MDDRTRVTVRVAGKDYSLISPDPKEFVERVAGYVDRKMAELGQAKSVAPQTLAVMTALTIADDLLKAHDENTRLRRELTKLREDASHMQREMAQMRTKI